MNSSIEPLIVTLVLAGRDALVIGGDDEALDKARKLHAADARVTVVHRQPNADLVRWIAETSSVWLPRDFVPEDLSPTPFVVFSSLRDPALSARLWEASIKQRFLLCCSDQPAKCSYTHTAIGRVGAVSISLSSGGRAPMLLKRLRDDIVTGLRGDFEDFSRYVSDVRLASPKGLRASALARCLEGFSVELKVRLPEGWRARWESVRKHLVRP